MEKDSLTNFLRSGINQLNLSLQEATIAKLISYISLLTKWNKVYNLIGTNNQKSIIVRHIFDSLAITQFIKGLNILDFGSGAGFPGLPLALVLPQWNFILLDSSKKKTTFLKHVMLMLDIENIKIVNNRVEKFHFEPSFATIVTRATTKSYDIIEKIKHLCSKSGQILIMKGKYPKEELEHLKKPFEIHHIEVPYLNEERHIIRVLN
ncbi:MAG: 16S rRNA (guanine(527)-N(7))-methyltransferase RsmG [Coxiellaceae bacterium]|jgi:16S rRNA (guanine527-N7)-methyltransferase|nr:16S rRNA (guanine(527)-N(7))-methyltransferase RsmG [Coxiellaceae bacterium]